MSYETHPALAGLHLHISWQFFFPLSAPLRLCVSYSPILQRGGANMQRHFIKCQRIQGYRVK